MPQAIYGRISERPRERRRATANLRVTPATHQRLRIAAAQDGVTMADLVGDLLDMRDDRLARRAAQRHPLARPSLNGGAST